MEKEKFVKMEEALKKKGVPYFRCYEKNRRLTLQIPCIKGEISAVQYWKKDKLKKGFSLKRYNDACKEWEFSEIGSAKNVVKAIVQEA